MTAATLVVLGAPSPAPAATTYGQVFAPNNNCSPPGTIWQVTAPNNSYQAPSDGVITSWSFQAAATPPQMKLKAMRLSGGSDATVVGDSALETPQANQVNTFPARIPVRAGDTLGISLFTTAGNCVATGVGPAYAIAVTAAAADPPPGATVTPQAVTGNFQMDVAAVLEPDCDSDGFGDETQDADTASCIPDTSAPAATITKGPKNKTKKKTATFEFTGTDARVVAGFECSLDDGAFAACTSPHTVKVKKGKHTFAVRAIDQAGNVDATPATDGWKVKKKRKK